MALNRLELCFGGDTISEVVFARNQFEPVSNGRFFRVTPLDSIAKDIRNEKFTFDEAAPFLSHDKETRNNHGLMANPNTGTARFEMQDLAQVSQEWPRW